MLLVCVILPVIVTYRITEENSHHSQAEDTTQGTDASPSSMTVSSLTLNRTPGNPTA